jgi:potassium intermediate/small conductance calcium-activated channel subfamily N protein 2
MIRIVEGPVWYLDNDSINFNVIQNCIWCVVVTMTTVGYGDYYPKTNLGRFILMLAVYTGTTLVSFMVVALQNYLKFTDNQIKVLLTCNIFRPI